MMNLRKPFCWLMLLGQFGFIALLVLMTATDAFSGFSFPWEAVGTVADLLPHGIVRETFVDGLGFIETWWFLILVAFFGLCPFAALFYVLLFGPINWAHRVVWLALFWFVGPIAIPAYFIRELYLLRTPAA